MTDPSNELAIPVHNPGPIAVPPPSDPRVLGTQDLVWALLNSPAFLFNR